jgi:hypothetical protein
MSRPVCYWNQEDDEYGSYETDCGSAFIMTEGTPSDNDMKFCCYCGKKMVDRPFNDDEAYAEDADREMLGDDFLILQDHDIGNK